MKMGLEKMWSAHKFSSFLFFFLGDSILLRPKIVYDNNNNKMHVKWYAVRRCLVNKSIGSHWPSEWTVCLPSDCVIEKGIEEEKKNEKQNNLVMECLRFCFLLLFVFRLRLFRCPRCEKNVVAFRYVVDRVINQQRRKRTARLDFNKLGDMI